MCQGANIKKIDIICTFIECGVREPFVLKGFKFKNMEIEMLTINNYYTNIPGEIVGDPKINFGAKLLFGKIQSLSHKEGFCWSRNKYLAKFMGVSDRTIQRWIGTLKKNNYIKSEIIYKEGSKEVACRKLSLNSMSSGHNKNVVGGHDTDVVKKLIKNNTNKDYYIKKERNARTRKCEVNELNKKKQELENEIERLKKQLEELKSQVDENKQLKKALQDCNHNQTYQDFEPTNQLIQPLKEEFSEISANPTIIDDSSVQPLKDKCMCESANKAEYKKSSTHQYCGQDVNDKSKSCSKSMQMYGRESFDEITTRRISNTEERVKLGKYLAFIIKRFGNITNDLWNTFLDRYLSLSDTLEKRLANLDYSFSGGYSNIFSAPKNEFRPRTQYADINIFG